MYFLCLRLLLEPGVAVTAEPALQKVLAPLANKNSAHNCALKQRRIHG